MTKVTGCAECNRDDAMESVNETNAALANRYLELLPKLEAAEKDAVRYRWLANRYLELLPKLEAAEKDAVRYRWLAEHPNEWRLYRRHSKHLRPFKMMRDGEPWGKSFSTAEQAIDAAMKEQK